MCAVLQLLLYEETQDERYEANVNHFMTEYMPGGTLPYTPCGLVFRDKWGSNRYAGVFVSVCVCVCVCVCMCV